MYGSIAGTLGVIRYEEMPILSSLTWSGSSRRREEEGRGEGGRGMDLREYGTINASRMKAIAAAESGEKVMPQTMAA
jgi:hypothetical protein